MYRPLSTGRSLESPRGFFSDKDSHVLATEILIKSDARLDKAMGLSTLRLHVLTR